MRLARLLVLFIAAGLAAQPVPDGPRSVLSLDGEWEAHAADLTLAWPPPADGWQKEAVPHETSRLIETLDGPYMPAIANLLNQDGTGFRRADKLAAWYRRRFAVDAADLAGRRAVLRLMGVAYRCAVYVNGQPVGTSVQCAVPNEFDISRALHAGDNELAIGVTGREGLVDLAHRCFIAPCNGMMAGIWGSVSLDLRPMVTVDDVFVRTSVKTMRLDLDVTVANSGAAAFGGTAQAVVVDADDRPLCAIAPVPVSVPAGGSAQVTLGRGWTPPKLWTPELPTLYRVRVELRSGALVDSTVTRFGFREFEIAGRDFQLNGRRIMLVRNSTLTHLANAGNGAIEMRDQVTRPYNCVRLHLGQNNPAQLDACDQMGMMAIPEAAFSWTDRYPSAAKEVWLANTLEYYRRWVKLLRNHPAVILWSLCNETYWDGRDPADMAVAEQLLATVRGMDPTRPQQGDGETSWDGRLPTINIHYPESEAGLVGRAYPNAGLVVPNDLWWLRDKAENAGWRAKFVWDRPLMLGEYWLDGDPTPRSAYQGDAPFDYERYRYPSRGIGESDEMAALQKATDYYRRVGVACLNPWYGNRELIFAPLDVRPMDYHPNLAGGQTSTRRVVVFNDTPRDPWDMKLDCRLSAGERTLWTGRLPAGAASGRHTEIDIPIACPAVASITPAKLLVRLIEGHGWELGRYEETVYLVPPATLSGTDPAGLLLLDTTGTTAKALAALGLNLPAVKDLSTDALAKARLLIIGEDTDAGPFAEPLRAWVAEGGKVLCLRSRPSRSLAPEVPEPDPQHVAAMAWLRTPSHPVLSGLAEGQLRWWRPDHLVAENTLRKPTVGRFLSLLDCGGRYGLEWTPLAEVRVGRGLYLLSALHLADRVGTEPLAGELLARLVRYGLATSPPPARAVRLLAGGNEPLRTTLAACSVVSTPGLEGEGPILVDGSQPLAEAEVARLKAQLAGGGTVWLHGFTPEALAKVASLFPMPPKLVPYDDSTQGGAIRQSHAWAGGLSSFDLYWTRIDLSARGDAFRSGQPTAKLGAFTIELPSVDAGRPLCSPNFLSRLPVGSGAVLLDTLGWEAAYGAETAKVSRLVCSLTTQLGGEVKLPAERDYDYFGVDLSAQVNMGYYDPTPGDGRGGWTDQGRNDMRFFLINHTGRAGGIEGAAEEAQPPWPKEVRFAGRPFWLVDPTKGPRTGVIALRGGAHGPSLPAQVSGIKVGRAAERLWFLHTACWAVSDKQNAEIGRYVVHYADGTTALVPLRYGQELQDWWSPAPLSGSQVAWTGRNLEHSPVGIWVTPWENPRPDQPIASIDLVGNLTDTQLVLLGITGGVGRGGAAERLAAQWRLADLADGKIANRVPGAPPMSAGQSAPVPFSADGHAGLTFTGGQQVTAESKPIAALTAGKPFSLEMTLRVDKPPVGYMGGLFECMRYGQAGFRLVYYQNMKLGAEIYPGTKPAYLTGQTVLQAGRFYRVKLVFDGQRAQLLLDGKLDASVDTAPPAGCDSGLRIGSASGKDYNLEGAVEEVALRVPAGP